MKIYKVLNYNMIPKKRIINGILAILVVFCGVNAWQAWQKAPDFETIRAQENRSAAEAFKPQKLSTPKDLKTEAR